VSVVAPRRTKAPADLFSSIYHRFTVDSENTITAMRLFQDEPKWVPHERSEVADSKEARGDYLQKVKAAIGLQA
jgi:1,2-dihydroxy-3-keto-5-methylthiopentene dioxygenase